MVQKSTSKRLANAQRTAVTDLQRAFSARAIPVFTDEELLAVAKSGLGPPWVELQRFRKPKAQKGKRTRKKSASDFRQKFVWAVYPELPAAFHKYPTGPKTAQAIIAIMEKAGFSRLTERTIRRDMKAYVPKESVPFAD